MNTRAPLSGAARLSIVGLIGTGIGFVGAAVDPGPGPQTVKGSLTVAHLYLPPLLVGLVALAIAALVATGPRWMPVVGGAFALMLLIGPPRLDGLPCRTASLIRWPGSASSRIGCS